ncbi:ATP-dependent Clp protease proteolytic subunit [Bailinhaonella thermotolerans]|uniref:ATP-dependent Clp protease proteolytic subunit n=1 Tax=Bailinhaonella thermotolerans TaxID=1070861 RepID=A0A3A4B331_9ACTN|nr:ATP-dependent Clp protease proteolytic subunit [Bailinhaonella thermotolerans]RJL36125.1 ATP-dependent Clp protease proteolytic subunit [Bailinhaonella thermotolerans]
MNVNRNVNGALNGISGTGPRAGFGSRLPEWGPFPPELPGPGRTEPQRPEERRPDRLPSYFVPLGPDPITDRLFERRIVMVHGRLDDERVTAVSAQLLTLDALGEDPIRLHLNTPDADLGAAVTLIDTLDALNVPLHAQVIGEVGGPAVGVLAAAHRRQASPNAVIRLSEPRLRLEGNAAELAAATAQMRHMLDTVYFRIADITGREVDEIRDDALQGRRLTSSEALDYGLIHEITTRPPAAP